MCGGGQQTSTTTPYGDPVKYDAQGKMIPGTGSGQRKFLDIGQQYAFENLKAGMPDMYEDPLTAQMDPATKLAHKQMLVAAGGAATKRNIAEGRKNLFALGSEADLAKRQGLATEQRMIDAGGQAIAAGLRGEERGVAAGLRGEAQALTDAAGIRGYGADAAAAGQASLSAVDPYASSTMGYGTGAIGDLSQERYAEMNPFERQQYEKLLAGTVDSSYLEPAIASAGAQLGRSFTRDIAPAIRTGTINTGQGRGYSTRESVIAGLEGERAQEQLAQMAGPMHTQAIATALAQRLPAAEMGLRAQEARIGRGFEGGDLRLRGGQLAQSGALGAGGLGAQAGQLGLGGVGLAQQGALQGAQLAQSGALGAGGLYGQGGAAAQQGLRTAQAGRLGALGATRDMTTLPGDMAAYAQQVGQRREQQSQAEINEAAQRDSWAKMKERQGLENYMRLVSGQYGGQTTIPGATGLQQAGDVAKILAALGMV
jgi:hypothetical protein